MENGVIRQGDMGPGLRRKKLILMGLKRNFFSKGGGVGFSVGGKYTKPFSGYNQRSIQSQNQRA